METSLWSLKALSDGSEETRDRLGYFAIDSMSHRALAGSCVSLGQRPWGDPERERTHPSLSICVC